MPAWSPRSSPSLPLSEEQLRGLLKRYDSNGDGRLSKNELKTAFRSLGLRFSSWRAGRALRHADANGDGFISDEEINELVRYATTRWGFYIS
ncbi:Calcium-binding EF-hand family protein, putative [Theobroma cacao]|uniref:Calcium-binding EF-hand family protein, putative n=1 Tax=Theobroma cacao TaxID=3641 RepID=A0A061FAV4_THECC|nr:Calcium-binding EF-hand family protein, putative [Theobroma cacao]